MNKKVLLIAYNYLPKVTAGSFRMHAWAKYLPHFGWDPIILTRHWDAPHERLSTAGSGATACSMDEVLNCPVYRVPYHQKFGRILALRDNLAGRHTPSKKAVYLRRIINFILINLCFIPDEQVGWYPAALDTALDISARHDIDLILSTGGPWTDFRVAAALSKRKRIPWVADYRDPWSQKKSWGITKEYMLWYLINRIYEKMIIANASAVIHISEPLGKGLEKILKRQVYVIPNGFDPEMFSNSCGYFPPDDFFLLSFVGTLHNHTNTGPFLKGFHRFVTRCHLTPEDCRVVFTGDSTGHKRIEKEYNRFGQIKPFFTFNPPVSQENAIRQMRSSHILLSFPLNMEGCCPAKTYEYLASKRPILSTPGGVYSGSIIQLLTNTDGGVVLQSPSEVANWLEQKYSEFKETGRVTPTLRPNAEDAYNRRCQVEKLAEILDAVTTPEKLGP